METKEVILLALLSLNLVAVLINYFSNKRFYEDMYARWKKLVQEEDKQTPTRHQQGKWKKSRKKYLLLDKYWNILARGTVMEIAKTLGIKKKQSYTMLCHRISTVKIVIIGGWLKINRTIG